MASPYTRETIENWVGDFCQSDRMRQVHPSAREHASAVLVEFLAHACGVRGIEPAEVEEADLKAALLDRVSRLDLAPEVRARVPELCALFLAALEEDGRLGGGRVLGAFVRALREPFERKASGKGETFVRPGSKIGRNDPCPCGSGKKYKACCMRG